jgi:hypothetical protein
MTYLALLFILAAALWGVQSQFAIDAISDAADVLMRSSAARWGAIGYLLISAMTFGHLLRVGRRSLSSRVLQLGASLGWPLYWLVVVGIPGTIRIVGSGLVSIFAAVVSIFTALDELFGRRGETLRWLYFLPLVGFPMFYIYGHWQPDDSWTNDFVVILKAFLWAPFWPVYFVASLYYS